VDPVVGIGHTQRARQNVALEVRLRDQWDPDRSEETFRADRFSSTACDLSRRQCRTRGSRRRTTRREAGVSRGDNDPSRGGRPSITAVWAPSTPPLSPAAGEVIVNSEVVPVVKMQSDPFMRPLHTDSIDGRSYSVVEWPADVSLRRHWHPVTERLDDRAFDHVAGRWAGGPRQVLGGSARSSDGSVHVDGVCLRVSR
jgi:hypothetical protein